jgi:hypothetical protein
MRIFIPPLRAAEDNGSMKKERDLLPWIFGSLSAAAIAVAFAAVSTHRAEAILAPPAAAARALAAPTVLPAPATAQSAPQAVPPAVQTDSAPNPSPPQAQTAIEPQVHAGQIWECTTKGVKTFSNNPCGEKSTLLEVGPVNSMSPLPAVHYAGAYGQPRYAAGYPDQSAPADADDYSDQYAADTVGNSYTIVGVVPRRRPEQIHRSPAPPAHHNSAPARRY